MSRKERGDFSFPETRHHESDARHPLVEVRGHPRRNVVVRLRLHAEVRDELRHHEPENNDVVDLEVPVRRPDARRVKQLLLELVHLVGGRANVEQDDLGVPIHQPSPTHYLVSGI